MNKDISKIPRGIYCYDENGTCPYWRKVGENGFCDYMELGDENLDIGLLWDQCKECGINEGEEDETD